MIIYNFTYKAYIVVWEYLGRNERRIFMNEQLDSSELRLERKIQECKDALKTLKATGHYNLTLVPNINSTIEAISLYFILCNNPNNYEKHSIF